jgi:hypothetical protein
MDKEVLVENIKEWMRIDDELKELQKAAKERRARKKEITDYLVHVMRENEIDCFESKEGNLLYSQTKTKASISKKYLLETLSNFYKDNPEMGHNVCDYILNNRQEKVKEVIKRKKIN